jgi:hypothetical protein
MPPHKKWKDNAERQRAFQLKKIHPDYDDNQIRALLGKPELKQPDAAHQTTITNPSAGNDPSQKVSLPEDFLLVVQYTAQAQRMCDSWRPSDTINYLKDKDKIIQAQEVAKQSLVQLSVSDLLQVIKPGVSWPADPSLSTSSSAVSNSTTNSVKNN